MGRLILVSVLQDLCPRCGAELLDVTRACAVCGLDETGSSAHSLDASAGIRLRPMDLALVTLAILALVVVAFEAGSWLRSTAAPPSAASAVLESASVGIAAPRSRIVFAERLGDSLELETYRTQFTRDDTIAWRAEFVSPPPGSELTVVIEWYSIRERMKLSESRVTLGDPELTMVASDEVPLSELVPTAGLYAVSYYAGDTKLAEGIFELLPRDD